MVFSLLLLLKKWDNFLYFLKMNILFIFEKMSIFSLKTSWLFGKVYFEKEATSHEFLEKGILRMVISWVFMRMGFRWEIIKDRLILF